MASVVEVPGLWPAPDHIRQVSVTAAVDLLQCGLRAAFKADRTPDVLPISPRSAAVLGTLAHELAEAVARGEFDASAEDDLGDALEAWWERRAHQEWERLRKVRWLGVIPPPPRWRHYQRVRVRSIAMARSVVMRRRSAAWAPDVAVAVEQEFASDNPPLRGRVDKIETAGDDLRVVDLKTGAPGEVIKPEHRVQLLLYAALLRASGMRPTEAAIEYLDGSRHSLPIFWEEVDALVAEVLAARDQINEAAQEEDATPSLAALAKASKDNCRFCAFRICCKPFQEQRGRDPGMDVAFLTGEIVAIELSVGGLTLLVQSTLSGAAPQQHRLIGIPREVDAQEGDRVTVSGAIPSANGVDMRVTWETCLVLWTSAGSLRGAFPQAAQPALREIAPSLGALSDDADDI